VSYYILIYSEGQDSGKSNDCDRDGVSDGSGVEEDLATVKRLDFTSVTFTVGVGNIARDFLFECVQLSGRDGQRSGVDIPVDSFSAGVSGQGPLVLEEESLLDVVEEIVERSIFDVGGIEWSRTRDRGFTILYF